MASSYVLRETAANLVRNAAMTIAAVVTMAVSLTALGGVLIMRQAVNTATVRFQGGVELLIFLKPDVSAQETAGIREELASMTPVQIARCAYMSKETSYIEFRHMFANQPDFLKVVSVANMPPSFRCVPAKAQNLSQLDSEFSKQPGVFHVLSPYQEVKQWLAHFSALRNVTLFVAGGVMVGAIALVVTTIHSLSSPAVAKSRS